MMTLYRSKHVVKVVSDKRLLITDCAMCLTSCCVISLLHELWLMVKIKLIVINHCHCTDYSLILSFENYLCKYSLF